MAGVPVYDAPQEQLRPLGSPDLHSVASPEVLGGAARNAEKFGKGLAAAGDDIAQVAIKIKQRDDADQVFRAETALKDAYLKQEQEWRKGRQGRFAQGLTQEADKWWNDQIQQQAKGLKSADAQRLFAQRAASYREQGLTTSSHWEQSQLVKSEDDSYKATQSSTVGMAVAAGTPVAVDSARDELRRKVTAQGALRGWTPEIVQAETTARLTDLHTQMVQGLAKDNPAQAAIYFEKFKDEIDGAKHAELGKFAQQASATHLGEVAADSIWQTKGPKADLDPVELDKMETAAREQFKNDDFARKAAIAALRERATAHNSSQAERKAANTNSVMDAVRQGAGINQIRRMVAFDALPGDEKARIEEHIETRRNILEARDSAGRSRLEREQLVKFSAAYHTYSDPDMLAGMTRAQVQALEPVIGREYADRLLTKWETSAATRASSPRRALTTTRSKPSCATSASTPTRSSSCRTRRIPSMQRALARCATRSSGKSA
jgi:hypothetical protein